ncbi:MAG: hypothetical protein ACU84J_06665 [Gammaproteobacteria bacterium]
MKHKYQSITLALLLLPFGSNFAEGTVGTEPNSTSSQDVTTEQQRAEAHQMVIEQRKKMKAEHDAFLREKRAAELKKQTEER